MGQSDLQQNRRVIQTHHEVLVLVLLFLLCPWNHLLSIHLPTHQLTMLTCLDPACTRGTVQHSTTPTYVLAAPSDTRFVSFSPRSYCCWCCWRHCRWCRWQQRWWWCHWCIWVGRRGPRPHRETVHLGHHGSSRTHARDFFPWLKWAKLRAPYPAAWGMLVSCASAKKWSLAKSDFWYLKNYGRNLSCYKWLVDFKPSKIGQNGGGVCSKCFAFPKCERICMQKFHYQQGERIFKAKNLLVNKKKTYEVHSQVL